MLRNLERIFSGFVRLFAILVLRFKNTAVDQFRWDGSKCLNAISTPNRLTSSMRRPLSGLSPLFVGVAMPALFVGNATGSKSKAMLASL